MRPPQLLDPGRDVKRLDLGQRLYAALAAPGHEIHGGAAVSAAGVRIADVGGEEFKIAASDVLAGRRQWQGQGGP